MTRFAAVLANLRRRPAATLTMDDLTERPGGYVGLRRSGQQAEWKSTHTPGRHRAQHVRPEGERPDRRIEKTVPLDLARLREIAGGAR